VQNPGEGFVGGGIAAVLFDKDGTLFDFRATWLPFLFQCARDIAGGDEMLASELVRAAGYDPEADRFAPDGAIAAGNAADIAHAWLAVLVRRGSPPGRGSTPSPTELTARVDSAGRAAGAAADVPVTDLYDLFLRLRRARITLGVLTSDSTEAARAALARQGVLELMSYVAGYDGGGKPKPDPEKARAFFAPLGTSASEVVVVGDTWHDMKMARACGCRAVGVLTGAVGRSELEPYADVVLASIADLPELLGV